MRAQYRSPNWVLMVCITCAVVLPTVRGAANGQQEKPRIVGEQVSALGVQSAGLTPACKPPTYKPPRRGAPGGRITTGTRGATPKGHPYLTVLAPDHLGLTTRAQPILYWFISEPSSNPVEFTLNDERSGTTLIQAAIPSLVRGGIHCIDLARFNFSLTPDREYRWFVTLVIDPEQPSGDLTSGGLIQRVEASPGLKERLVREGDNAAPVVYAEEGIWYDALASVRELPDSSLEDGALLRRWAGLLGQVGLRQVTEVTWLDNRK